MAQRKKESGAKHAKVRYEFEYDPSYRVYAANGAWVMVLVFPELARKIDESLRKTEILEVFSGIRLVHRGIYGGYGAKNTRLRGMGGRKRRKVSGHRVTQ